MSIAPAGTPSAPSPPGTDPAGRELASARPSWRDLAAMAEVRWAAIATVLFALGGIAQLTGLPAPLFWTPYLACCVTGGWEPALAGVQALRQKSLDVDLLMIVAAIAAVSTGQVFDGALLIVIFSTSGALEAFVTARTESSVRALLDLAPERATRLHRGAGGGARRREEVVAATDLAVGDLVLVRPGERIAADASVVQGRSEVDQASITGEAAPVVKDEGAEVFAGTLNGTGSLVVRVDKAAHESVVARIVALVAEASETKARRQLFIETVERRYSIAVVIATLALFLIPLALGREFQPTLLRAMTFMIVASPCALVLATMPPLLASIANAGRHGVLVKSAVVMERLAGIDQVAFDKTGTLTGGSPQVSAVLVLASATTSEDEALGLAAAAEAPSEHPLARAITAAARSRGLTALPPAEDFTATPGRGVSARVGAVAVEVTSAAVLAVSADHDTPSAGVPGQGVPGGGPRVRVPWQEALDAAAGVQESGQTTAVVLVDGVPVAVLALADRVRPGAGAAVTALTAATGRSPVLVTGDNAGAAHHLARQVGITDVRAQLLPQDKVTHVQGLQASGRQVLLVGDGINDAPALAAADLGVAMGRAGSDLALQTADAVVIRDELETLPRVIGLSRRAQRVVKTNIAFAACVIIALVTWDLLGHLPLPLGVAGHEGSTVVVGLNGLRLLSARTWFRTTRGETSAAGTVAPGGGREG